MCKERVCTKENQRKKRKIREREREEKRREKETKGFPSISGTEDEELIWRDNALGKCDVFVIKCDGPLAITPCRVCV